MEIITQNLWNEKVGDCEEITAMSAYIPENRKSDMAIIILAGGGYCMRSDYEDDGYARFLADNGYLSFVVSYRVAPYKFPLPLLDARRAVRTVRFYADKFGIDKNKIALMGSSAGGHLTALTSTYYEPIEFEGIDDIDKEDAVPNYQILCYPVITLFGKGITHFASGRNLLGDLVHERCEELSPHLLVSEKTPPAFIWHTFSDNSVNVLNSLMYAEALRKYKIPTELHIFPDGAHGLGLAKGDDKVRKHVSEWNELLLKWLEYID